MLYLMHNIYLSNYCYINFIAISFSVCFFIGIMLMLIPKICNKYLGYSWLLTIFIFLKIQYIAFGILSLKRLLL